MSKEELVKEVDRYMTILSADGALPNEVDAHYVSWGSRQVGEAGDSVQAKVLVISGRWLYIYDLKFVAGSETAQQRVVPRDSVREVTRNWKGRRGFDEGHFADTADEFSMVIEFEEGEPLRLPIRESDYGDPPRAWKKSQAFVSQSPLSMIVMGISNCVGSGK